MASFSMLLLKIYKSLLFFLFVRDGGILIFNIPLGDMLVETQYRK